MGNTSVDQSRSSTGTTRFTFADDIVESSSIVQLVPKLVATTACPLCGCSPSNLHKNFNLEMTNSVHMELSKGSCRNLVTAFVVLCLFGPALAIYTRSLVSSESSCETLSSTIHITKEVTDDNGQLVRTCEGDLAVNKCEGTCASQLQPSVVKSSGFLKDCQCCRESHLREREVVLPRCYDEEGQIMSGDMAQLVIRLKEPAACRCYKCGGD